MLLVEEGDLETTAVVMAVEEVEETVVEERVTDDTLAVVGEQNHL